MWVMTEDGFVSIVAADERSLGQLVVRARSKVDLEHFVAASSEKTDLRYGEGTDYPWRAVLSPEAVATALARIAMKINYGNFKDRVHATTGPARARTYGRVWTALTEIEREPDAEVQRP
jgi:hypothetical protein